MKELLKKLAPNLYFAHCVKAVEKEYRAINDPVAYTIAQYERLFGVRLNLKEPKDFYEKILYLKFFHEEEHPEELVDKVLVKDYLAKRGLENHVARKIAAFPSFSEFVSFFKSSEFPKVCVIKLNHTSGDVFFYDNGVWRDKVGNPTPKRFVFACLKQKLKLDYSHVNLEKIYSKVVPQILVEEYYRSKNSEGLAEYKFFCNHGKIILINVVYGRQKEDQVKEAFTDAELRKFDVIQDHETLSQEEIIRPSCFEEMKETAKMLSENRTLIRVDLLLDGDTFRFCELTFYDCAGMNIFHPSKANRELGDLITL